MASQAEPGTSSCPCWDSSTRALCIPKRHGVGYNLNFYCCFFCCVPSSQPNRYEKFEEQSSYHGVTLTEEEQFYATDYELYYDKDTQTVVDTKTRWSQAEPETAAIPRTASVKLENTTDSSTTDFVSLQPQAQQGAVGFGGSSSTDPDYGGGGGGWGGESGTDTLPGEDAMLMDEPPQDDPWGAAPDKASYFPTVHDGADAGGLSALNQHSYVGDEPRRNSYYPVQVDDEEEEDDEVAAARAAAAASMMDSFDPMSLSSLNEQVPIGEEPRRNSYYPPNVDPEEADAFVGEASEDEEEAYNPGGPLADTPDASWDDIESSVYHSMTEHQ